MWPRQIDRSVKRATKQGLRPCFICGVRVENGPNYCFGCGKIICHNKMHWNRKNGMLGGHHHWNDHGNRWKVKK